MAGKNNIRSMRFSDKMIELIEQQVGDTFTAKFEALVTKCAWEIPQKERELKSLQDTIDSERKRLEKIRSQTLAMENNAIRLNSMLAQYVASVSYTIKSIENKLEEE